MANKLCLTDMYWSFRIHSNVCIYSINSIYMYTHTHISFVAHWLSRADNGRWQHGHSSQWKNVWRRNYSYRGVGWRLIKSALTQVCVCVCVSDMRVKAVTQCNWLYPDETGNSRCRCCMHIHWYSVLSSLEPGTFTLGFQSPARVNSVRKFRRSGWSDVEFYTLRRVLCRIIQNYLGVGRVAQSV